jgi:hypothetical protein
MNYQLEDRKLSLQVAYDYYNNVPCMLNGIEILSCQNIYFNVDPFSDLLHYYFLCQKVTGCFENRKKIIADHI